MKSMFGITKIRPKVIFGAIESRFPQSNNAFKVNIPSSEIGGMTLLESSILVSLLKLSCSKRIFEFGTYMGATSVLLAENSDPDVEVTTLDIPPGDIAASAANEKEILFDGNQNDLYLKYKFATSGARCIYNAPRDVQARIKQMLQNSLTLDPRAQGLHRAFDYILIDGGHDYETVTSDTANAYEMAKNDALIVWHDFESTIHSDVTTFLREHSATNHLYHVENSMIAFQLLGDRELLLN